MKQVARNLTDVNEGFLVDCRCLIMEHDSKYTKDFRVNLDREGVKPVRCPARAPNRNAFAERFVRVWCKNSNELYNTDIKKYYG